MLRTFYDAKNPLKNAFPDPEQCPLNIRSILSSDQMIRLSFL